MHNILKNNAILSRRHVLNDSTCMRCGHIIEDALYAVRDYVDSKRIWLALISKHTSHTCFTLDVRAWIVYNMKNHLRITNEKDRSMLLVSCLAHVVLAESVRLYSQIKQHSQRNCGCEQSNGKKSSILISL